MRLLVINPNISDSVSALIQGEAERSASPGTRITMLTAPFGVAYIETRFEALIGAYAVAQLAAEHQAGHDAVIVAAFGDPGLTALREVMPVPVLGLTESALASACLLGHRFSIIAISQRIQAWYREVVEANGLIGRLASIRALDRPLAAIGNVQGEHADALRALYRDSPFFRVVLSNMEQVLAKADLDLARRYASLVADRALSDAVFSTIEAEWQRTLAAFYAITGQSRLLEHNPTLARSLDTRLPYLDAMGVLQVELLRRLREESDDAEALYAIHLTINGVAAGLRNSG